MAIVYTWSFPTLDVVYNEIDPVSGDPVQNVVSVVHWIYTAVEDTYTASTYGTVTLPPPGMPFVDFDDLTPEIVEGWVVGVMGEDQVAAMETSLANQIEAQKNPTGGSLPPPWTAAP